MAESSNMVVGLAAARVLELLTEFYNDRPLRAIEIAESLSLAPDQTRERRKRIVRDLAIELRKSGQQVCAGNEGYWLARDGREYRGYLDALRTKAVYRFVAARKYAGAAAEVTSGQGRLW